MISGCTALVFASLLTVGQAAAVPAANGEGAFPRLTADPLEPRFSVTWSPASDLVDAVVGTGIPLARWQVSGRPARLVLEGAAFLRLGKEGAFFPLQTVDGLFGLGVETRLHPVHLRLRATHVSAHKADGDSTVSFRGQTFSREFITLEAGYPLDRAFLYGRAGTSWHAVPRDRGLALAVGATWTPPAGDQGLVAGLHLAGDGERSWRVTQSAVAGWRLAWATPTDVLLTAHRGHTGRGQYWNLVERYLGIRFSFGVDKK